MLTPAIRCSDIIPVDYVARVIIMASQDQATVGRVLHLCSGHQSAVRLATLREMVRDFATRNGEALPRLRLVAPYYYRMWLSLIGHLAWGAPRRNAKALAYLVTYLEEEQAFDITQTREYLDARNVEMPRADCYLERMLRYVDELR